MICVSDMVASDAVNNKDTLVAEHFGTPVLARAYALASRIARQSPIAVRSCMRSLRIKQEIGLEQALWREADVQSYCYGTEDMDEGLQAIGEKRRPAFVKFETYSDLENISKL